MAVHVLEGVGDVVGGGHQLNHTEGVWEGDARNLVEALPLLEVFFEEVDHAGNDVATCRPSESTSPSRATSTNSTACARTFSHDFLL